MNQDKKPQNNPKQSPSSSLLLKAYNLGWNHCLFGDDSIILDMLSDEEIIQMIKEDQAQKIRQSEWQRTARSPQIPLPVRLQEKYQNAIRYAGFWHKDQKMPSSEISYIVHISNVAMEILLAYFEEPCFDIDFAVQLALLHDVLEDTDCGKEDLLYEFGPKITDAVSALSKEKAIGDKQERMADSLRRIQNQPAETAMVKLADRITNLQKPPVHWKKEKIRSYQQEAQLIYDQLKDCNQYLAARLRMQMEAYKMYF